MERIEDDRTHLIALTAEIVSAYVSNNHIQSGDLPRLLGEVHGTLCSVSADGGQVEAPAKASPQEIRRSIAPDFLISFEDGKPYKTLRRHLTLRGLTAEAYRAKWGLDPDYPMTAQTYSEQRSQLARSLGLGQQRRTFAAPREAEPESAPATPAAKRRRARSQQDA